LFSLPQRPASSSLLGPNIVISTLISNTLDRPGREADHSPPSSAEVKNSWSYISAPPVRLHSVVLSLKKKHKNNFTFTFTLTVRDQVSYPHKWSLQFWKKISRINFVQWRNL
jgi:hypothetical protein